MAKGKRPAPFRTRKLSPSAPMVLRGGPRGRVGRRRTFFRKGHLRVAFVFAISTCQYPVSSTACRKVGPWSNVPIVEDRQVSLVRGVAGRRAVGPDHPADPAKAVHLAKAVRLGRVVRPGRAVQTEVQVARVVARGTAPAREGRRTREVERIHVIRVIHETRGNLADPEGRRFPRG
jgi:hypothetical protein